VRNVRTLSEVIRSEHALLSILAPGITPDRVLTLLVIYTNRASDERSRVVPAGREDCRTQADVPTACNT